jgi:uncharacterized membrane protein
MDRPKLKVNFTAIDWIIEILCLLGQLFLIILPLYYFNELPTRLPSHFNIYGQPDLYRDKSAILIFPFLSLVLYIGLTILNKFPNVFNYPVKITNENAERLYTIGTKTIRILKFVIIATFFFLTYRTIKIVLNNTDDLGLYFLPIYLITIIILILTMIYKMVKKKQ